jgi:hypothetical protein
MEEKGRLEALGTLSTRTLGIVALLLAELISRRKMGEVVDLRRISRQLRAGGEPPDNGDMEARTAKLEAAAQDTRERLARIETKMDQYATKADLAEAKNSIVTWVVSAVLLAQLLPAILKKFGL